MTPIPGAYTGVSAPTHSQTQINKQTKRRREPYNTRKTPKHKHTNAHTNSTIALPL